jgi:hypothetical protein
MDGAVVKDAKREAIGISGRRASLLEIRWMLLGCVSLLVGCSERLPAEPVLVRNDLLDYATVAVAPALNLSGSTDFDPNRFADLMAGELSYVDRIRVIPVSRVLGVLAAQGQERVSSARHAGELADWLGADVVLVFAVTEYDPYEPPRIGISAQLFGKGSRPGVELAGPVDSPRRFRMEGRPPEDPSVHVLAETQRVFDASHAEVLREIRGYAARRTGDESPYGWRKYVVSQELFARFCSYATIDSLLNGDRRLRNIEGGSGR